MPPNPRVTVRDATRDDMPLVQSLIKKLAEYEGIPDGPTLTADDLIRDGFDCQPPWFYVLIAELDGAVVGYAIFNRAYSSWTARAYYVEDLYVVPEARRCGVGYMLMRAVIAAAAREGATRVDWHVLENNAPARALYARLGSRDLYVSENRLALRLDEHHIQRLAREADAEASQQRLAREADAETAQQRLAREAEAETSQQRLAREADAETSQKRLAREADAETSQQRLAREADAETAQPRRL